MRRCLAYIHTISTFLMLAGLISFAQQTTSAQQAGGIGGKPANPNPANPRTQSIFVYTIRPGDGKQDAAIVSNNTAARKTIEIYAVDALTTNTGTLSCKQKADKSNSVGKWVVPTVDKVTLDPGQNQTVPFTAQLPSNIHSGEHNGCLVFQEYQPSNTNITGNIRIRTRQALRVAITVPGDLKKELSIASFSITTRPKDQDFKLTIRNSGNVSADTKANVKLTNLFGHTVYQNGGGYPVLASKDLQLRFHNKSLPMWGGIYTASATVSYDTRPNIFGTSDPKHAQTLTADTRMVLMLPSTPIILLYALIIAFLILLWQWCMRRRKRPHSQPTSHKEP